MPDYSRYTDLLVEIKDKIAVVTLNDPDSRNPISGTTHRELEGIWEDLARDDAVRVAILTGAGKAFSAGGNVKGIKSRIDKQAEAEKPTNPFKTNTKLMLGARRLVRNMLDFPKPLIGAINGDAIGLGATVALLCDTVIAKENARFADTHVKIGIAAGDGGCIVWPLLIGVSKAKKYLFTGKLIDAKEAERIGLISEVVTEEEFWPTVMEQARELANGAPGAIMYTKMTINKILKERMELVLDTSLALEFLNMTSDDHKEAMKAFFEKRPADFKGE